MEREQKWDRGILLKSVEQTKKYIFIRIIVGATASVEKEWDVGEKLSKERNHKKCIKGLCFLCIYWKNNNTV